MKKWLACLMVFLLLLCSGCGEDVTYQLNENGTCRILITAENAANYEWVVDYSQDGIVILDDSGFAGTGLDFTGYSSSYWYMFRGISNGSTDVLFNYRQTYEGGSMSAITRLYELRVDADGRITACTQYANTLGSSGNLYCYLKCNPSEGYNWEAASYDEEIVSVNRTGAEEDTDPRFPGQVWQVFHFDPQADGEPIVVFYMKDASGNVVHTIAYQLHLEAGKTPTCILVSPGSV